MNSTNFSVAPPLINIQQLKSTNLAQNILLTAPQFSILFYFLPPIPTTTINQSFLQVLRTWEGLCPPIGGGGSLKFDGEDLSRYIGGAWGHKTLLKNTCAGVHLLLKLLAISLQVCKFTKNELHIFFKDFSQILSYYLLCFFQEPFHGRGLHVSMGEVVFQMGASFLGGGTLHAGHWF